MKKARDPLAAPLIRFIHVASTLAGQAYVEFRQLAVAEADRHRRDLLELLLAGELPARGPSHASAKAYGIGSDAWALVVSAAPGASQSGAEATQAASVASTRAGLSESTLVVVRHGELVAVPVLRAGADLAKLCERIEDLQERLGAEGTRLAVGVSTIAAGVAELPRAYQEARAARECLAGRPGVVALPRLAPFEYLVLRADETARRVVDPRLHAFLAEDLARGGVLSSTVQAFARADLNLRAAAERLSGLRSPGRRHVERDGVARAEELVARRASHADGRHLCCGDEGRSQRPSERGDVRSSLSRRAGNAHDVVACPGERRRLDREFHRGKNAAYELERERRHVDRKPWPRLTNLAV